MKPWERVLAGITLLLAVVFFALIMTMPSENSADEAGVLIEIKEGPPLSDEEAREIMRTVNGNNQGQ